MVPQVVRVMPAGRPALSTAALNTRAPKCSCRYRFPLVVVNRDPSSAGANSEMCSARVSATTVGNGTARRDLGVLGGTRYLHPGASRWPSWTSPRLRRPTRRSGTTVRSLIFRPRSHERDQRRDRRPRLPGGPMAAASRTTRWVSTHARRHQRHHGPAQRIRAGQSSERGIRLRARFGGFNYATQQ